MCMCRRLCCIAAAANTHARSPLSATAAVVGAPHRVVARGRLLSIPLFPASAPWLPQRCPTSSCCFLHDAQHSACSHVRCALCTEHKHKLLQPTLLLLGITCVLALGPGCILLLYQQLVLVTGQTLHLHTQAHVKGHQVQPLTTGGQVSLSWLVAYDNGL